MNLMMLNVGYATHHADWNWQKVSSPFIRIFYIEEGEAMLHLPETDVRLKPELNLHETYELPTEVPAGKDIKQLFEHLALHYPDARLPGADPKSYDTSAQTSDYVARYRNMALWEKMELRGAMLMMMSQFIKEAKPRIWTSDERMKRVLRHIHEHISDEIDVKELADVASVTKTYFIRLFKQEFGVAHSVYQ